MHQYLFFPFDLKYCLNMADEPQISTDDDLDVGASPVANEKAKEESSDDDSSDDEEKVKPAPKVEAAKPAAKKEESSSDEDSSDEEEEKKPGMYLLLSFSKIKIGIFSNHIFRTISLTFKMC